MRLSFRTILMVTIVIASFAIIAKAQEVETVEKEVEVDYTPFVIALEQSGLPYQKSTEPSWTIHASDGELDYHVAAVANGEVISMVLVVAPMPEKISGELLEKLAELNNRYYLTKFAFGDNNIYMRIDMLAYSVNGSAIRNFMTRMAVAYNSEAEGLKKLAGVK